MKRSSDPEMARCTITGRFFVPSASAGPMRANLEANGRLALTAGEPVSHELYQMKGAFVSAAPATPEDMAIVGLWADKAIAFLRSYGLPDSFFSGVSLGPVLAVTFRVEELFAQSPGPGAGAKIQ